MVKRRRGASNKRSSKKVSLASENATSINILNDDCLRRIFQYLPINQRIEIERVSKRWQMVSKSSWSDFTHLNPACIIDDVHKKINKKSTERLILIAISRGGLFLRKIHFENSNLELADILKYVGRYCINIETFYLSHPLGNDYLQDIDELLNNIFSKNQNITVVNLGEMILSGHCFLGLNGKKLESLSLYWIRFHENSRYLSEAFSKFKNLTSCTIFLASKNLEIILKEIIIDDNKINYLRIGGNSHELFFDTNPTRLDLSKYFLKLKKIKFIELWNLALSNEDLIHLSKTPVERLSLDRCIIFNSANSLIVPVFNNLLTLEIKSIISEECFVMLVKCKNLKDLNFINCCRNLDDEKIIESISKLPQLEKLTIQYQLGFYTSSLISDSILPHLTHIKELIIIACRNISNVGLCNFLREAYNLEYINVSGLYLDQTFVKTALETVNVRNNKILTILCDFKNCSKMNSSCVKFINYRTPCKFHNIR